MNRLETGLGRSAASSSPRHAASQSLRSLTSEKHAAMQHSMNRLVRDMNSSTWLRAPNGIGLGGLRLGGILSASMWLWLALVSLVSMMLMLRADCGVLHSVAFVRCVCVCACASAYFTFHSTIVIAGELSLNPFGLQTGGKLYSKPAYHSWAVQHVQDVITQNDYNTSLALHSHIGCTIIQFTPRHTCTHSA